MVREAALIDISDMPDLARLAEEVQASGQPRVLARGDDRLAMLIPVPKRRGRRQKTAADYEAFRSSAGSWKDVDTDRLLRDIYESRRVSSRPPVDL